MYREWRELSGLGQAQELVRREIARVDGELARIRASDLDLGVQVRDTWGVIHDRSVELAKARREIARGSLRARGIAARRVLDRIVLWFRYEQHGSQVRSYLDVIDFVPLVGDPVSVPVRGETSRSTG